MKIPRWKHVLSYLTDIHLMSIVSHKNGPMQLFYSSGEFKLTTLNVVYSWGKHYRSFAKAITDLKVLEQKNIESVLVLGWGMGSIAKLLEDHPSVKKITGVDHDGTLVKLYNAEFKDQSPFDIKLHVADAMKFVMDDLQQYDLICCDIFVDNITPPKIIAKPFLSNIHRLLKPNGLVLLSKLNRTTLDRKQNEVLEHNLRDLNIDFQSLKSFGNSIYWWRKENK
ncbi:MAG: methyltransferase domain-containing protein [Chitinophagales bacterium]